MRLILWMLFLAWACLATSIVAIGFAMRAVHKHLLTQARAIAVMSGLIASRLVEEASKVIDKPALRPKMDDVRRVQGWNDLAFFSFFTGMILLGSFIGYNLWKAPLPGKELSALSSMYSPAKNGTPGNFPTFPTHHYSRVPKGSSGARTVRATPVTGEDSVMFCRKAAGESLTDYTPACVSVGKAGCHPRRARSS